MKFNLTLAIAALCLAGSASSTELCEITRGAAIIYNDGQYLGRISSRYDERSIFNSYGEYGSEYRADSIWNPYGQYGSPYMANSATNKSTLTPPQVVKNGRVIGYLSDNKSIRSSVSPAVLRAMCEDEM